MSTEFLRRKEIKKTPQEMQDEIFRKMSAEEKIRLTSDFSNFLFTLHGTGKERSKFSNSSRQRRADAE